MTKLYDWEKERVFQQEPPTSESDSTYKLFKGLGRFSAAACGVFISGTIGSYKYDKEAFFSNALWAVFTGLVGYDFLSKANQLRPAPEPASNAPIYDHNGMV